MSEVHQKNASVVQVPENLDDLLGFNVACVCGREHSVETKKASIQPGALDDLVPFARETGKALTVQVVADRVTQTICGDKVVHLLAKDGHRVSLAIVPDGQGQRPHANEKSLQFVESTLKSADLAVSVGSGTINDLTKLASFKKGIPYIAVATAPSMNGYTSAIAAIMQRGIKRTIACHQPIAVVADLDILKKAPIHLIGSGLGDLESKPTATADYRLGGLLRGTYYCSAPERVVFAAEARASESAEGLSRGDPESIAALTEALILSGISMKLAGSSSPASGGEHLISHHWDMTAKKEGRIEGWHGAQVGVATIVTATLYEHLRLISPSDIDIDAIIDRRPKREDIESSIRSRYGKVADEVVRETFAKRLSDADLAEELARISNNLEDIWFNLDQVLRPSARIKEILKAADAPVTVSSLGLTPEHLTRTFLQAREIRGRFTILDFAAELGLLEQLRDGVLKASGCLS